MLEDPLLQKYSVIILDDCHERSLNSDLAMGLLKKIRRKRPDLKLIISSATNDVELFYSFFEDNQIETTINTFII